MSDKDKQNGDDSNQLGMDDYLQLDQEDFAASELTEDESERIDKELDHLLAEMDEETRDSQLLSPLDLDDVIPDPMSNTDRPDNVAMEVQIKHDRETDDVDESLAADVELPRLDSTDDELDEEADEPLAHEPPPTHLEQSAPIPDKPAPAPKPTAPNASAPARGAGLAVLALLVGAAGVGVGGYALYAGRDMASPPTMVAAANEQLTTDIQTLRSRVDILGRRLDAITERLSKLSEQGPAATPAMPPDIPDIAPLQQRLTEVGKEVQALRDQVGSLDAAQRKLAMTKKPPARRATATPTRPAASAHAKPASGRWAVAISSLSTRASALDEMQRLHGLGLKLRIVESDVGGRTYYRIIAPGFESREKAAAYSKTLRRQHGLTDTWLMALH